MIHKLTENKIWVLNNGKLVWQTEERIACKGSSSRQTPSFLSAVLLPLLLVPAPVPGARHPCSCTFPLPSRALYCYRGCRVPASGKGLSNSDTPGPTPSCSFKPFSYSYAPPYCIFNFSVSTELLPENTEMLSCFPSLKGQKYKNIKNKNKKIPWVHPLICSSNTYFISQKYHKCWPDLVSTFTFPICSF